MSCSLGLALLFAGISSPVAADTLRHHQTAPSEIEAAIARLAEGNGVVGVAAWRLDRPDAAVLVNADQGFPMASTFKIAVAGAVLARIDAGNLKLTDLIDVPFDSYVTSDVIANRLIHPGVALSVANLLELMITESDNTASDTLMRLAGGPAVVSAWVRDQGVVGQRIDRNTDRLLRDVLQLPEGRFREVSLAKARQDPDFAKKLAAANPAANGDPRDSSTPRAMANLLSRIASGKALSAASTKILLEMMGRTRTGTTRLPALLPPGTAVAHKTGTLGSIVNDVGFITLPGGRSTLVLAVFHKEGTGSFAEREAIIARIGRTLFDFHLAG